MGSPGFVADLPVCYQNVMEGKRNHEAVARRKPIVR